MVMEPLTRLLFAGSGDIIYEIIYRSKRVKITNIIRERKKRIIFPYQVARKEGLASESNKLAQSDKAMIDSICAP